jgi:tetratricopeptide (TPR) repeat protein
VRSLACALLCGALGADARGTERREQPPAASRAASASRDALQQAALLVRQGRLDEAEKHAALALSNPDTRGAAHSVLGAIRFQQQRLDESARILQEAIRLEPRLIGAHLTLAEVHIAQGHPESAVALFRRALELDPMNPTARFGLARSEAEKGNYQASLEIARPVLEAFKLFPEGLFVLATDYLKTKDRQAAAGIVDYWTRSTDIPQAWSIRLARLYAEEGVPSAAIDILERAKPFAPPSYELAFNLGGAYLLNGDAARALASYDDALRLQPESVEALRQAAAVAEQAGELERSLSYWMRARQVAPDDPGILLGFGRVCGALPIARRPTKCAEGY